MTLNYSSTRNQSQIIDFDTEKENNINNNL